MKIALKVVTLALTLVFLVLVLVSECTREIHDSRVESCVSNEQQIWTGLREYAQDYDNLYPLNSAAYKEAILPYVKEEEAFHCPEAANDAVSYSFNKNLAGINYENVEEVENSVLIYEGADMIPNYPHSEKTVITFADGAILSFKPEEVSAFLWNSPRWRYKPVPRLPAPEPKQTQKPA